MTYTDPGPDRPTPYRLVALVATPDPAHDVAVFVDDEGVTYLASRGHFDQPVLDVCPTADIARAIDEATDGVGQGEGTTCWSWAGDIRVYHGLTLI